MRDEVRWERMFPDELEQAFTACPLVYFSYGLCEPHGPHNALGLDALKAHALACAAARASGGIVAPPDYWHIHELGGFAAWLAEKVGEVERSWLTAVPPWVHFKNVCYQTRAADSLGFQAAILLTGHYGANWPDLKTLVALIQPYVGTRLYALPDFEANTGGFFGDGDHHRDHAGKVENVPAHGAGSGRYGPLPPTPSGCRRARTSPWGQMSACPADASVSGWSPTKLLGSALRAASCSPTMRPSGQRLAW